ncbi:15-hydroxyprostaglandin dehydrogenase [NAD(+)]-like [Dermacentor variabilis]|uniref:15-hydroxyprostaglandin dehydrogenase [NAD(+)]-like n=1 Tax=Dermacentor variabilis TaxID=34621 RepID=UPI003F5C3E83
MSDSLHGKVALVTGGAMGLGKAITEHLLQQGCRVAFIDLNESAGIDTERGFRATFGEDRVIFMKCDITKDEAFEDCFVRAKKKFGRLDIVVNNAGFAGEESWRKIFEINTMAVYFGTLLALKYMGKDRGGEGGYVINIASIAGLIVCPPIPAYNASKYGVIGLTRAFGTDLYYTRTGVKVSCLCPEPIETAMWRGITSFCQEIALNTPYITENYSSGVQRPENVAKGVIKLIEDGVNGAALLSLYDEGLVYHEFSSVR